VKVIVPPALLVPPESVAVSVRLTVPPRPSLKGPPALVLSAVVALTVKHSSVVSLW
jgi:hypothetical protein